MNKFTIINPINSAETKLTFSKVGENTQILIEDGGAIIDNQQLYELGVLFIALAGDGVDYDAANELLNGFDISDLPAYNFSKQFVANSDNASE